MSQSSQGRCLDGYNQLHAGGRVRGGPDWRRGVERERERGEGEEEEKTLTIHQSKISRDTDKKISSDTGQRCAWAGQKSVFVVRLGEVEWDEQKDNWGKNF